MTEKYVPFPDPDELSEEDDAWAGRILNQAVHNVFGPKKRLYEPTDKDFADDDFWHELLQPPPNKE